VSVFEQLIRYRWHSHNVAGAPRRRPPPPPALRISASRLEQLDQISRRILGKDLLSTHSNDSLIAEDCEFPKFCPLISLKSGRLRGIPGYFTPVSGRAQMSVM
jgi:hypothetical protein